MTTGCNFLLCAHSEWACLAHSKASQWFCATVKYQGPFKLKLFCFLLLSNTLPVLGSILLLI